MKIFVKSICFYLLLSAILISCTDKSDDFNPQNLSNDDIKPPISNRLDYVIFEKYEQSVLLNSVKIKFQEDSITKKLWTKLTLTNNFNDIILYEPEYTNGRLTKLIDRTGLDQDIEVQYYYDSKIQKHLITKIRYFKKSKPYAIVFNYSNSKLKSIDAIEIDSSTRYERPFAYESLNICQNLDSCNISELQYQLTDIQNPFYLSNEMLPIFLCLSDFSNSYQGKLSNLARYLPLYTYNKLPYSYLINRYNYTIDFEKDILYDINYKIVNQNPVFISDFNVEFAYRY